jgi:hypothetical protein
MDVTDNKYLIGSSGRVHIHHFLEKFAVHFIKFCHSWIIKIIMTVSFIDSDVVKNDFLYIKVAL